MKSLAKKATRLLYRRGIGLAAYHSDPLMTTVTQSNSISRSAQNMVRRPRKSCQPSISSFSTALQEDTCTPTSDSTSNQQAAISNSSLEKANGVMLPALIVSVSDNKKMVTISDDSHRVESANYHAAWLWANDPAYCHPSSGQKLRSLSQYDPTTARIMSADIIHFDENNDIIDFIASPPGSLHPRGGIYETGHSNKNETTRRMLQIEWQSGDTSSFDLAWLLRFCTSTKQGAGTTRVTKEVAIGAIKNSDCASIPIFDYHNVMENDFDDSTLLQVLDDILQRGAVLIQNAPTPSALTSEEDESIVANLGRRICGSNLSHGSLYGDVFHVQSMSNAHNIAYTSVALPPHQDLTYYESKPFLQLLHCVQNAPTPTKEDTGKGESVLIDAMAAAEHLRMVAPRLFRTLCMVEATFCKQREGADMASAKPHIVTSSYDQSVIEVNWSPPFEGPLQLPPSLDIVGQERLMDDYVVAYQAMECILNDHSPRPSTLPVALGQELRKYSRDFTWEYALKEGEILVFNNQRMLHGRRSFTLKEGTNKHRHLIGCYTDAMDTLSHYRLLLRQQQSHGEGKQSSQSARSLPRNPGNGSRSIFVH